MMILVLLGSIVFVSEKPLAQVTDTPILFSHTPTPTPKVYEPTLQATESEVYVPMSTATSVATAEATPTKVATVNGYSILNRIDMRSGLPYAMSIELSDGQVIGSTWARAIAFNGTDDIDKVFSPFAGTVYSFQDEILATWIHSGRIDQGELFAFELEEFIIGNIYSPRSMEDGLITIDSLLGSRVTICQAENPDDVTLFDNWNATAPCPGQQVVLDLVAAVLIERESVEEFDTHVLGYFSWINEEYPNAGFDQIVRGDGYMVVTCVGQFYDQRRPDGDDTPSYQFNRLVLGMNVVEEP